MTSPSKNLLKAEDVAARERPFTQRLNPNSYFVGAGLSRAVGMQRAHVTIARLPPGKESFAYHGHMLEEEWVYILSGRGIADIDGESFEVGPGDFMGFPTPAVAHLLRNPYDTDLAYLMGGEDHPLDVLDYPTLGKRMLLIATERGTEFYELGEPTKPFGPA